MWPYNPVCRHILRAEVPDCDLPSARSAVRFADVGHALSKIHIADSILKSNHFDLHVDRTTKSSKKLAGHQITLDNGQNLACGFTVVCSENSTCLVDIAIGLLEELSLVFENDFEKRHEVFIELLQRLNALMTDRAAVMKAYGRQLNETRKDLLQSDDNLAFLFCNAHFLLGLVGGVDKAFKDLILQNRLLGRERLPKFQGSGSRGEHAVIRCIREACAILGPRGDERYSCREHWMAFCMMTNKQSEVTSFKGNRFNNLFQASAALHFHRHDILENYMSALNWKQEGVLADLQCDTLDDHLISLGVFYFRLTGPYWQLLGRDIQYLDFYVYVVMMKQFLEKWAEHPADAFTMDFEPMFHINIGIHNNPLFFSLLDIDDMRKVRVQVILKRLSATFLEVVKNQLNDFLPSEEPDRLGGKYFVVRDENLRKRLEFSKITNLIGEQCFGDLDFSVFKRRNASTHHHSTVNLLQRNKTLSDWFVLLSPEDRTASLAQASLHATNLRSKHRQEEALAIQVWQELLQEARRKKIAAADKRRQRIADIFERLRPHHGPCKSPVDVCNLLRAYTTVKQQKEALKAEVMFHKLIMKDASPLLQATAKLPALVRSLKQFMQPEGQEEVQQEEDGQIEEQEEDMELDQEEDEEEEDMTIEEQVDEMEA